MISKSAKMAAVNSIEEPKGVTVDDKIRSSSVAQAGRGGRFGTRKCERTWSVRSRFLPFRGRGHGLNLDRVLTMFFWTRILFIFLPLSLRLESRTASESLVNCNSLPVLYLRRPLLLLSLLPPFLILDFKQPSFSCSTNSSSSSFSLPKLLPFIHPFLFKKNY